MTSTADLYPSEGKKKYVAGMFDDIAVRYDFLNHFLSLNIDRSWRKTLVKSIRHCNPKLILDVATGTADLAILLAKKNPGTKITGIDISDNMLEIGRRKVIEKGLDNSIELFNADAENLKFNDHTFDAVTVAFGVRNFENLNKGLSEIFRVLKEGGCFLVLEFSMPRNKAFLFIYRFYFRNILPFIGRLISKHFNAYSYLPGSVSDFPEPNKFMGILQQIGFKNVKCKKLTFGVCTLYTGIR